MIVFLYGTTCAGKSTLAKLLSLNNFIHIDGDFAIKDYVFESINALAPESYKFCKDSMSNSELTELFYTNKIQTNIQLIVDTNQLIYHQKKILLLIKKILPKISTEEICNYIYNKASKYLEIGKDVVIDTFFLDNNTLFKVKNFIPNNYKVMFVLCYSEINVLYNRCIKRNNESFMNKRYFNIRSPIFIIHDILMIYKLSSNKQNYIEKLNQQKWNELIKLSIIEHKRVKNYLTRFNKKLLSPVFNQNKTEIINWNESKIISKEYIKELSCMISKSSFLVPNLYFDKILNTHKKEEELIAYITN